jgi:hypothetical protein
MGSLYFWAFFIIIFFISLLVLIPSSIFIVIYIKKRKNKIKVNKILVTISIIGMAIGLPLFLIPVNIIGLFIAGIPTEVTRTVYVNDNELRDVEDVTQIEQNIIDSIPAVKQRFGFLKMYATYYNSYKYRMAFKNISWQVKKIKFKSVWLIINGMGKDLMTISNVEIGIKNEHTPVFNHESLNKRFVEQKEITFHRDKNNMLNEFIVDYNLGLDTESSEFISNFSIIYDIEIELENGDIINIGDLLNFKQEIKKEIVKELGRN